MVEQGQIWVSSSSTPDHKKKAVYINKVSADGTKAFVEGTYTHSDNICSRSVNIMDVVEIENSFELSNEW
jgi:hypothetical protein